MAEHVVPIPQVAQPSGHAPAHRPKLYVLDYGAGNVRRYVPPPSLIAHIPRC